MKRRGYSLIEMSIVIALLTILLSGAAMLLASLMIHTGRQRVTYNELQVATRLGEAFRRDVRGATKVQIGDGAMPSAGQLTLNLADGTQVEYQVVDRGVERIARDGDQPKQRELYRLSDLHEMQFTRGAPPAGDAKLVVCTWQRRWHGPQAIERDDAALRAHRIEAAPRQEAGDE